MVRRGRWYEKNSRRKLKSGDCQMRLYNFLDLVLPKELPWMTHECPEEVGTRTSWHTLESPSLIV
jgi:hypothetical protein